MKYYFAEVNRIQNVLDTLDNSIFSEDGPVKIILRNRIKQEKERANNESI